MKYVPCEKHRRVRAELESLIQTTTTAAELMSFGGDQRELRADIAACTDCTKLETKGGN